MTIQEWLEVNYAKLQAYAMYRCRGDREQAGDLLQEMIAMILEGRIKVDLTKSPLTYLQCAMATMRGRIQHGPTKVRTEVDGKVFYHNQFVLVGDEWLTAQVQVEEGEGFDFYPFFALLPPKLQPVMELHLEGLSYREIGQRLGRPFQTVSDQIRQGVERLRVLIHDAGDGLSDRGRGEGGRLGSDGTPPKTPKPSFARMRGLVVRGG